MTKTNTGTRRTKPSRADASTAAEMELPTASAAGGNAEGAVAPGAAQEAEEAQNGAILFVRGPAKGFRRAGLYFPAEGLALKPGDLGQGPEGVARLLAILKEPELTCKVREADGTEQAIPADEIAALEAKLESTGEDMADFVASLFDGDANPA